MAEQLNLFGTETKPKNPTQIYKDAWEGEIEHYALMHILFEHTSFPIGQDHIVVRQLREYQASLNAANG